ncbi:hypothetical protein [Gluconacetobacter takamatsuzukensis]|uniref:Uncharacterized protein n=1 Tax=Gluconacetobacter takamatsuzukensis TaxID=1286190 RepID=A0A7W4KGI1_9PROT|nr:hypothetical protein [Gluconacetobacter takamatsuzukensis]MBB2206489.1 hypothetical protein [Gluconacetobacter takamatsuzukensis]
MREESVVTIQYDRLSGDFQSPVGVLSEVDESICVRLNRELSDIRSWLHVKRNHGLFSHRFLVELTFSALDQRFPLHAVYDEIGKLEGTDEQPSMTKKPRQMRKPLKGLWHKHYFGPNFMMRNLIDETERMAKDGRWDAMFSPHIGKFLSEFMPQVSHEMVMGAFQTRACERRVTGEFLVYERRPDGSNYYLTLGMHGDWDAIRTRVDEYKEFDEGTPWPHNNSLK